MAAMAPPSLIGSAITPTSISQPFGAFGPHAQPVAPSAAEGSASGGMGFLGAGVLNAFNGIGSGPSTTANIYAMQQGAGSGVTGNISAALSAASLANRAGAFGQSGPAVGGALGAAGGALGIYNGIQQGGVQGYGGAAVGALRAGSGIASLAGDSALSSSLGAAAGYIAAPLSVYSAINNWRSGATGSDALQGAEAGAAVGSMVLPGVGTLIGGVIGGVVGAVSSAFGGGQTDPETKNWQSFIDSTNGASPDAAKVSQMTSTQNMSPQTSFNLLAGIMDIKNNTQPFVNAFGRMNEGQVLTDMTDQINSAIKNGKISKSATPQQLYQQVVQPWLNSKGATIGPETGGIQLQGVLTNLIGHWQNGSLNASTDLTSSGSTDSSLEAYG